MIELRPNQTEPVRKAIEFFNESKPKPSLIVLPTAWGKSILTAFVAKSCTDKMIVLQPSKELLKQNFLKYCNPDMAKEFTTSYQGARRFLLKV